MAQVYSKYNILRQYYPSTVTKKYLNEKAIAIQLTSIVISLLPYHFLTSKYSISSILGQEAVKIVAISMNAIMVWLFVFHFNEMPSFALQSYNEGFTQR